MKREAHGKENDKNEEAENLYIKIYVKKLTTIFTKREFKVKLLCSLHPFEQKNHFFLFAFDCFYGLGYKCFFCVHSSFRMRKKLQRKSNSDGIVNYIVCLFQSELNDVKVMEFFDYLEAVQRQKRRFDSHCEGWEDSEDFQS